MLPAVTLRDVASIGATRNGPAGQLAANSLNWMSEIAPARHRLNPPSQSKVNAETRGRLAGPRSGTYLRLDSHRTEDPR